MTAAQIRKAVVAAVGFALTVLASILATGPDVIPNDALPFVHTFIAVAGSYGVYAVRNGSSVDPTTSTPGPFYGKQSAFLADSDSGEFTLTGIGYFFIAAAAALAVLALLSTFPFGPAIAVLVLGVLLLVLDRRVS